MRSHCSFFKDILLRPPTSCSLNYSTSNNHMSNGVVINCNRLLTINCLSVHLYVIWSFKLTCFCAILFQLRYMQMLTIRYMQYQNEQSHLTYRNWTSVGNNSTRFHSAVYSQTTYISPRANYNRVYNNKLFLMIG